MKEQPKEHPRARAVRLAGVGDDRRQFRRLREPMNSHCTCAEVVPALTGSPIMPEELKSLLCEIFRGEREHLNGLYHKGGGALAQYQHIVQMWKHSWGLCPYHDGESVTWRLHASRGTESGRSAQMILRYLCYVLRHKWFVFLQCCHAGIPWRGLLHDLSKLLPDEFFPYASHFYGPGAEGIQTGRDETDYYKPTDTGDAAFDFAWLLHQKRNRHHWQWWCLLEDEGRFKVLDMPLAVRREMLADWLGAGCAQGKPDVVAWYRKHKDRMRLHPVTRAWVEQQLGLAAAAQPVEHPPRKREAPGSTPGGGSK